MVCPQPFIFVRLYTRESRKFLYRGAMVWCSGMFHTNADTHQTKDSSQKDRVKRLVRQVHPSGIGRVYVPRPCPVYRTYRICQCSPETKTIRCRHPSNVSIRGGIGALHPTDYIDQWDYLWLHIPIAWYGLANLSAEHDVPRKYTVVYSGRISIHFVYTKRDLEKYMWRTYRPGFRSGSRSNAFHISTRCHWDIHRFIHLHSDHPAYPEICYHHTTSFWWCSLC